MAHVLVDDLDQTVHTPENPVRARHFAFGDAGDMTTYTVDLTDANYQRLVAALQPFLDLKGTRELIVRSGGTAEDEPSKARSKEELTAIREWATKNGHKVSPKGRIAGAVLAAYDQAHANS